MGTRVGKILMLLLVIQVGVRGQTCVDDYYAIDYATSTVQNPVNAVFTSDKEILLAGSVLRVRSVLQDGWLTKLSPQGTLLWSRNYTSIDFNWIHFNKAVPDGNEGYIVAGHIGNRDTNYVPPAVLTQMGFLMKVDKYGNKLWTKMFGKNFIPEKSTDINNIIATTGGDFIIVLNYRGQNSVNIVVRIDGDGNIKWTSTISSTSAAYGQMHVYQKNNGDIVVANPIMFFDANSSWPPVREGYYAACIGYDSGLPKWQRSYIFTKPPSTREKTFGDVVQIADLPNGDLSFISSYADTSYIYFRKTKKVINMITDDIGRLKNVRAYYGAPPLYASAGATDQVNGGQAILMDNADAPFLMKLDAAGNIAWQHSYPLIGRSQETRTLLSTEYGFYFFSFTHNGGSKDLKLIKTDLQGNADCMQSTSNLVAEDISDQFRPEPVSLTFDYTMAGWHGVSSLFAGKYKMEGSIICRNVCCTDVVSNAAPIDLCNVSSYTLPNNDVITGPGTYGVTYKTSRGCDSIVYYTISFSTDPIVALGDDACLQGKDSVILKTKGGYNNYSWMGANKPDSFMTVKQPGTYYVSVDNACGSNADTVEVFSECDFGVYIPNAFTPNGDSHNDFFGLPKLNKNKLLSLQIYNRWGQLIFHTSNRDGRWDGTYKGQQAPAGTYTYVLIVETLDKKRVVQKGLITLVR